MPPPARADAAATSDAELLPLASAGDHTAFEILMRRHNPRLFRVARAMLKDDATAEDVLQEAYLDAYQHGSTFRGQASVATWLTKIVVNRALMHLRRHRRDRIVVSFAPQADDQPPMESQMADDRIESPSASTLRGEVRRLIEHRLDELPMAFRTVFILRDVEDLSVDETAACLGIPANTVRTRLFRARMRLRAALSQDLDQATSDIFRFDGARCDRIVARVLDRAAALDRQAPADPPA